jgi:hypothetical protein
MRRYACFFARVRWGSKAADLKTSSWIPALVAPGFATEFVHPMLDRSVCRMSESQLRAAARDLLV